MIFHGVACDTIPHSVTAQIDFCNSVEHALGMFSLITLFTQSPQTPLDFQKLIDSLSGTRTLNGVGLQILESLALGVIQLMVLAVALGLILRLILKLKESASPHGLGTFEIEDLTKAWKSKTEQLQVLLAPDKKEKKQLQKKLKKNAKTKTDSTENLFLLEFKGDLKASRVDGLRDEISLILQTLKGSQHSEVVIKLESPGGTVTGYGLGAHQIARLKNKGIRVTVFIDQVAASGGYMMACVADRICAAPFSIIGSIGVLMQMPNFHRLLEKNSIDYKEYTAGEFKRTVTPFSAISPEKEAKLLEQIEETHGLFKAHVKHHRPELNIERVATGEYWFATQAKELGLIDEILTWDEYLLDRLEKAPGLRVLKVHKTEKKSLRSQIFEMGRAAVRFLGNWTNGELKGEPSLPDLSTNSAAHPHEVFR